MCQMEKCADASAFTNSERQLVSGHGHGECCEEKVCAAGSFATGLVAHVPFPDAGKKKRVHRAAKLKQCKMDARRQQWLAKVASKDSKLEILPSIQGDKDKQSSESSDGIQSKQGQFNLIQDVTGCLSSDKQGSLAGCGISQGSHLDGNDAKRDSSDSKSPSSLGCFELRHRAESDVSTWSNSDGNASQSNSSGASVSDEDKEVDDWEAVADVLSTQESLQVNNSQSQNESQSNKSTIKSISTADDCVLKPGTRYIGSAAIGSRIIRTESGRAWRPDDTSRPHTLPCLSKQNSFPQSAGGTSAWSSPPRSIWRVFPAPLHCPICTEELDTTDSSFMPCPCGFRLCLFCHHRILLGDGRCPGCRKAYDPQVVTKLSRTSAVPSRFIG